MLPVEKLATLDRVKGEVIPPSSLIFLALYSIYYLFRYKSDTKINYALNRSELHCFLQL